MKQITFIIAIFLAACSSLEFTSETTDSGVPIQDSAVLDVSNTNQDSAADVMNVGMDSSAEESGTDGSGVCPVCPQALATEQSYPFGIAINSGNVFWTNSSSSGSVMSVPKSGGTATVIAAFQNLPKKLVVNLGFVYWTNFGDGTVMRAPDDGSGAPEVLASGLQGPYAIAATSTSVFVTELIGLKISQLSLLDKSVTTIANTSYGGAAIAVSYQYLYWDDAGIYRTPLVGGSIEKIVTQGGQQDFIIDQVAWYNSAGGGEQRISTGLLVPNSIKSTVADVQNDPFGVTVDSVYVYWTNRSSGEIRRAPKTGGKTKTVASSQLNPMYITNDAFHLYWTDSQANTVMSVQIR